MTVSDPAQTHSSFNFGWALATLMRDYQKSVEQALHGLPGGGRAFLVMSFVGQQSCHSQIAIADRLAIDKTTLTYLLDGLENGGLVVRATDPDDRRVRHVRLTSKGAAALFEMSTAVHDMEQRIMSGLAEAEATQFRLLLWKVSGLDGKGSAASIGETEAIHLCDDIVGRS